MTDPLPTPATLATLDLAGLLRTIHGLGWGGGISGGLFEGEAITPRVWVYLPGSGWRGNEVDPHEEDLGDDPVEQLRTMLGRLVARAAERATEDGG